MFTCTVVVHACTAMAHPRTMNLASSENIVRKMLLCSSSTSTFPVNRVYIRVVVEQDLEWLIFWRTAKDTNMLFISLSTYPSPWSVHLSHLLDHASKTWSHILTACETRCTHICLWGSIFRQDAFSSQGRDPSSPVGRIRLIAKHPYLQELQRCAAGKWMSILFVQEVSTGLQVAPFPREIMLKG